MHVDVGPLLANTNGGGKVDSITSSVESDVCFCCELEVDSTVVGLRVDNPPSFYQCLSIGNGKILPMTHW